MRSAAAVAHLILGSTYCVFRYALLYALVLTCGDLSYCFLPIGLKQPISSPLKPPGYCLDRELPLIGQIFSSFELLGAANLALTTTSRSS